GLEIVERANRVPHFGAGRGVAERMPIPHAEVVGAVVYAWNLAKFDGIEQDRGISVARKPDAVMLILNLRTPRSGRVSADIDHGWKLSRACRLGEIQIGGDVKPGHTLEHDVLNPIAFTLQLARDSSV